jgi:uncharacterized membrane protein YgcG
MKRYPPLFAALLFFNAVTAQQKKLVLDHEKIFTAKEIASLDSMLQQYRRSSGRIILISTDTFDVSKEQYATNLVNQFVKGNANKPYVFMLLLSKKKVMILASVNDKVKPFIKDRTLLDILDAGIPSFKENRSAEGSKLVCKKAMEFLNTLPGK